MPIRVSGAGGFLPPPPPPSFYVYLHSTHASGTAVQTNGQVRLQPIFLPWPLTLQRIGLEVTAAGDVGSTLRIGAYADDGTGRGGTLVFDAGTVPADAVGSPEVAGSFTLPAGLVYVGAVAQGVTTTAPTCRTNGAGTPAPFGMLPAIQTTYPGTGTFQGVNLSGVTGALPATMAGMTWGGSYVPRVFAKMAP